jgi:hypothetical protein
VRPGRFSGPLVGVMELGPAVGGAPRGYGHQHDLAEGEARKRRVPAVMKDVEHGRNLQCIGRRQGLFDGVTFLVILEREPPADGLRQPPPVVDESRQAGALVAERPPPWRMILALASVPSTSRTRA